MLLKINCFLTLENTCIVSAVSTAFSSVAVTQLVQDLKYAYGAKYSTGKCSITGQQSVQAEDAGLVPTQNKSASEKLVEEAAVVLHAYWTRWTCSFCRVALLYWSGISNALCWLLWNSQPSLSQLCTWHWKNCTSVYPSKRHPEATLNISSVFLLLLFWGKQHHSHRSQIYWLQLVRVFTDIFNLCCTHILKLFHNNNKNNILKPHNAFIINNQ